MTDVLVDVRKKRRKERHTSSHRSHSEGSESVSSPLLKSHRLEHQHQHHHHHQQTDEGVPQPPLTDPVRVKSLNVPELPPRASVSLEHDHHHSHHHHHRPSDVHIKTHSAGEKKKKKKKSEVRVQLEHEAKEELGKFGKSFGHICCEVLRAAAPYLCCALLSIGILIGVGYLLVKLLSSLLCGVTTSVPLIGPALFGSMCGDTGKSVSGGLSGIGGGIVDAGSGVVSGVGGLIR